MPRRRYRPRADRFVVAVQLKLDTPGLAYRKWGHDQHAQANDWLVDNDGDVYTVAADSFARTYREREGEGRRGQYVKVTRIWAEQATTDGSVATLEGRSAYARGDWIVSNHEDGRDAYAITAEKFARLYEPDE
jgi:hypothetical protein